MSRAFSSIAADKSTLFRLLLITTIGLGLFLRAWQFSINTSLWLDELAVARNIIHLPLRQLLFAPLEYDQVTPLGFLAVSRLLWSIIPDRDWVFRVMPLVSSVLTLPLVYLIGRKTIGDLPAVLATALISLSPAMIGFSALAKQYASDIFICSILMYGALRIMSDKTLEKTALFLMGLCGGVLLFFSFPSVLVAFGLTAFISIQWLIERQPEFAGCLAALGIPLAACALLASMLFLKALSPETSAFMSVSWVTGFPPQSLADWPSWLWHRFSSLYKTGLLSSGDAEFLHPYAVVLFSLCLIGSVTLIVRRNAVALILLAPVAMALGAAAVRLYPFENRVAYFLIPILTILSAYGAHVVAMLARCIVRLAVPAVYAATLAGTFLALYSSPPPYIIEDMRPLMENIAAEWRPSDDLYSYYAANQAVDYYGERFGITRWDAGTCNRGNPRAYLEELDAYRGSSRVWIVFTHVLPRYAEADIILSYLRTIGTEQQVLTQRGCKAYLFDLSDPELPINTTAEKYILEAHYPVHPRFVCGNGPHAEWQRPRR
jgi:hypothetical protein